MCVPSRERRLRGQGLRAAYPARARAPAAGLPTPRSVNPAGIELAQLWFGPQPCHPSSTISLVHILECVQSQTMHMQLGHYYTHARRLLGSRIYPNQTFHAVDLLPLSVDETYIALHACSHNRGRDGADSKDTDIPTRNTVLIEHTCTTERMQVPFCCARM